MNLDKLDYDGIAEVFAAIIELKKDIAFVDEYKKFASDSESLGLLVSQHFEWDGKKIVECMLWALEDANFHSLVDVLHTTTDGYFKGGRK